MEKEFKYFKSHGVVWDTKKEEIIKEKDRFNSYIEWIKDNIHQKYKEVKINYYSQYDFVLDEILENITVTFISSGFYGYVENDILNIIVIGEYDMNFE